MTVRDLLRVSQLQHRDHRGEVVLTRDPELGDYLAEAFMDGALVVAYGCSAGAGDGDQGRSLFESTVADLEERLGPVA